ncbi:uncharacterized protein LOC133321650 [Musca vetustissima]|uniref:uncharacterized protein LOC133321650 n=1 Tax=Musca vetustissima TaxID=27455 RepID=UPI002AB7C1F6|nr:uncharacterized protein LOC133321650 [Musca vetustissima]
MRGLMVLCVVALCSAAPQGYNYPSNPAGHYLPPTAPSQPSGHYLPPTAPETSAYGQQHQQPLVTKRFFIHSAPEEEEVEVQHRDIVVGTPRKNFNVVFIKSATDKKQKTKIRVIPAVNEDKTVIYVLAKKTDAPQLETYVEEPATTTTKPEVFFIKYKTNEEAEHAQRSIQAEYDHLGGNTVISNEGVSPVSSVIGSLDALQQEAGTADASFGESTGPEYSDVVESADNAGNAYLPPVKKH